MVRVALGNHLKCFDARADRPVDTPKWSYRLLYDSMIVRKIPPKPNMTLSNYFHYQHPKNRQKSPQFRCWSWGTLGYFSLEKLLKWLTNHRKSWSLFWCWLATNFFSSQNDKSCLDTSTDENFQNERIRTKFFLLWAINTVQTVPKKKRIQVRYPALFADTHTKHCFGLPTFLLRSASMCLHHLTPSNTCLPLPPVHAHKSSCIRRHIQCMCAISL